VLITASSTKSIAHLNATKTTATGKTIQVTAPTKFLMPTPSFSKEWNATVWPQPQYAQLLPKLCRVRVCLIGSRND
jgi:hypothetical protein